MKMDMGSDLGSGDEEVGFIFHTSFGLLGYSSFLAMLAVAKGVEQGGR